MDSGDYNSYLGRDLSELIILFALSDTKGYSAYQLIKKIKEETSGKITFRAGTIYPQMKKLEENGLVLKNIEDTTSHSAGVIRQKSVYSLTKKGFQNLDRKKIEWVDLQNIVNGLLQD